MDKDILVLKDGTAVALEAGASLGSMGASFASKAKMVAAWDKMTEGNLSKVQVKNGAGLVVGSYTNLLLVDETSSVQTDGSVRTVFRIREKDAMEKRMDTVEEELTGTQMAVAETYELLEGLAGDGR